MMARLALVACALAACVQSNKVTCGDLTCPPSYTCDLANERCISPDQIAACRGAADGDACTVDGAPGQCTNGICEPLVCGDGVVTGAEQCDGTNFAGKTCRDYHYYDDAGLACTSACTVDISSCTGFCGDGIVNGGELCDGTPPSTKACYDLGYDAGPLACSSACGASFDHCARFDWQLESLAGVQALSATALSHDTAWVVGSGGAISRFDGTSWAAEASGVTSTLFSVAAASATDVWAVGSSPSVLLHRDATGWSVATGAPTANYQDVWATGPGHVFVATMDQGVLSYNGASWSTVGTFGAPASLIRGTSPSDLWAIDRTDGSLWHWDNVAWTPATLALNVTWISAVSPTDVWVIGLTSSFAGAYAHWDGLSWSMASDPSAQYSSVSATGPEDVWITQPDGSGLHFDGKSWSSFRIAFDNTSAGVLQLGPGEAFAYTTSGFGYRFTGQAYAHYTLTSIAGATSSMWSSSGGDMLLTQGTGIYRSSSQGFTKVFTEPGGKQWQAMAGAGASDIWAITNGPGIYHWDGGSWTPQTAPPVSLAIDNVMWAAANDVWTFSGANAYHGPGTWTTYTLENGLWRSVSGDAPNDVWGVQLAPAVTSGPRSSWLQRWNGSVWTEITVPRGQLFTVGVRAADDVWVATLDDHVLHWNGSAWSDTLVPTFDALRWIVPYAADDVFAASDLDIVHFDGTRWSRVRPDIDLTVFGNGISAVASAGPGHFQFGCQSRLVRDLVRTRPWVCRAKETNCSDGIDDDCDGKIDGDDSDCP